MPRTLLIHKAKRENSYIDGLDTIVFWTIPFILDPVDDFHDDEIIGAAEHALLTYINQEDVSVKISYRTEDKFFVQVRFSGWGIFANKNGSKFP